MAVKIGSARIDERGKIGGGKAGDQGSEVSRQNWYAHKKGWVILRPKNTVDAEAIARAMEAACDNPKIGYDQYQRNTLYNQVKTLDFDPAKATVACETDCSALVRVCCAYAGIALKDFTTATQVSVLIASGRFDKLTASKYTTISTYLQRGDILVTKTQGHTVVVLTDGSGAETRAWELGDRVLSNGMIGTDVKALQEALITLGYDVGACGCDGDYGNDTQAAVEAFQGAHGLARDGIYGAETHKAMADALEEEKDDNAPDDSGEAANSPDDAPDTVHGDVIVDLSRWNGKIKDADKLKSAVSFVIHRASCGTTKDVVLDYNAKLMRNAGIPFGVYHYIRALNAEAARREARVFYQSAMPYFPKFWTLDCEYAKITKLVGEEGAYAAREITEAFRDELIALGVKLDRIGVYIGHHLYKLWKLNYKSFAFVWIPRYGSNNGKPQTKPAYECDLWQYTSVGKCPGIADKTVDLNQLTGTGKDAAWFRGEK